MSKKLPLALPYPGFTLKPQLAQVLPAIPDGVGFLGWEGYVEAFLSPGMPDVDPGWLAAYAEVGAYQSIITHRNKFGAKGFPIKRPRGVWMLDVTNDGGLDPPDFSSGFPYNPAFWNECVDVGNALAGTDVSSFLGWHTYDVFIEDIQTVVATELVNQFGLATDFSTLLWGDVLFLVGRDNSGDNSVDPLTDLAAITSRFEQFRMVVCNLPLHGEGFYSYADDDSRYVPYGVEFQTGAGGLVELVQAHFNL